MEEKTFIDVHELQYLICIYIRNYCHEHKINLMHLAETVDISYEYLRHLLSINGRKSISLYTVYKLIKTLNINLEDLSKYLKNHK